jgi:hypothetical protein
MPLLIKSSVSFGPSYSTNVASSQFFLDAKNEIEARIAAEMQIKQNLNKIK